MSIIFLFFFSIFHEALSLLLLLLFCFASLCHSFRSNIYFVVSLILRLFCRYQLQLIHKNIWCSHFDTQHNQNAKFTHESHWLSHIFELEIFPSQIIRSPLFHCSLLHQQHEYLEHFCISIISFLFRLLSTRYPLQRLTEYHVLCTERLLGTNIPPSNICI